MSLKALRVVIQQPALPAYRIPVFRELSARMGRPVEIVCKHDPALPLAEPDGFVLEPSTLRLLRAGGRTLKWDDGQWLGAASGRADALVLAWDLHYLSLLPSLLRARSNRIGTVAWGHGYSKTEQAAIRFARDEVTRFADAVLFYDSVSADAFRKRTGRSDGVFVAANALDQRPICDSVSYWNAHPEEAHGVLSRDGVGARPYVLFVSRLLPENRLDVLVDAIARVTGLDLVVVGTGPDEENLRSRALERGVDSRVHFLGARYQERELGPWFLGALALCYPSNLGLSLHHAFGYGLPVLAGDDLRAHNPEVHALRDGHNGVLFKHNDPTQLAQCLRRLIQEPSWRAKLSDAARETAQEFTLQRMIDGFEAAVRYAVCCAADHAR